MFRAFVFGVLVGLGWSVGGFASADQGPVGKALQPIVHGHLHPGHPAVMALVAGSRLCTATLIAPKVAVTAKHCVSGVDIRQMELRSGPDMTGKLYSRIRGVRTTEGDRIAGYDIAVLLLQNDGDVEPVEWAQTEGPETSDTILVVGYGQDDIGQSGSAPLGTKRSVTAEVTSVTPLEFSVSSPATCFGDSGGPAFLDDGRLVGVVSRGVNDCNGPSVFIRMDAFAESILLFIEESELASTVDASSISATQEPSAQPDTESAPQLYANVDSAGCSALSANRNDSAIWLLLATLFVMRSRTRKPRTRGYT